MLGRVSRGILYLLGAVALLVLVLDCITDFHLETKWPVDRGHVTVAAGVVQVGYEDIPQRRLLMWPPPQTGFEFHAPAFRLPLATYHSISNPNGYKYRGIGAPLWLIAFLALAWPVTSFILARRKPKRGFPVEPKPPDAAVPPATS